MPETNLRWLTATISLRAQQREPGIPLWLHVAAAFALKTRGRKNADIAFHRRKFASDARGSSYCVCYNPSRLSAARRFGSGPILLVAAGKAGASVCAVPVSASN